MPTPAIDPRIAPLEPPFPDELAAALAKWMPPGSPVPPLALFRTLAHHNLLFERLRPAGAALLGKGLLPARVRELVILRTCARCGCTYEWGVHAAAFGSAVGLDRATIDATWMRDRVVAPDDALFLRAADELHDTGTLADDTWAALAARFEPAALLELAALAGFYHLISYVANAPRVPLEAWAARPPASRT
jgi:alkylhydroperoxidase family enzyme